MDIIEKIRYIKGLWVDLDAAFLVSAFFNAQKDRERIFINLLGSLKRRWSRDIDSIHLDTFEDGDEYISLDINRSGIYDSLPEAIFHDFPERKGGSGKEMAKESRRQKLIEKEARLFFKPVENELFNQRVQLILIENELIRKLSTQYLNTASNDFWLTATEVPGQYVAKFNRLLPFVHLITGNLELTAQCLEYIIEEKILVELINNPQFSDSANQQPLSTSGLGDCLLGSDTILDAGIENFTGTLNFSIGPLNKTPLTDFLNNGEASILLDYFFEYFIPFELEAKWNIILESEQGYFILNDEPGHLNAYLNYSTVI